MARLTLNLWSSSHTAEWSRSQLWEQHHQRTCEFMGIWKVRTLPYHAQTNGQGEWAYQLLMHMIGKLGKNQKADLPKHLPKLEHAYNSMGLTITGYSRHYMMYTCRPHLPINFYFPMIRHMKKHQNIDHYVAKLWEQLWKAFKEAQVQSMSVARETESALQ